MGEPATPTQADRAGTRRFAHAIVDAVRNDEAMTFGDKDRALFQLAQEVELLEHDLRDDVLTCLVPKNTPVLRSARVELACRILDAKLAGDAPITVFHEATEIDRTKFGDLDCGSAIDDALTGLAEEVLELRREARASMRPVTSAIEWVDAPPMLVSDGGRPRIGKPYAQVSGRPPQMYATLLGHARVAGSPGVERPLEVGELVKVEVPPNCTIHDADAQRLGEIRALAVELGKLWRNAERERAKGALRASHSWPLVAPPPLELDASHLNSLLSRLAAATADEPEYQENA